MKARSQNFIVYAATLVLVMGCVFSFAPAPKTSALEGVPSLLITEIIPNTDNYAGSDAFEYLEIYNNSDQPIDLKGYRIQSGNMNAVISDPLIIEPWSTHLFWTRTSQVQPISLEAFNHNYFSSYKSKYMNENQIRMLDNVPGIVNGGQTIKLLNPQGIEVIKVVYTGADVLLKNQLNSDIRKTGAQR
ncbi:lamin tail domain-containing protein [Bacillus sp. NEB1478]|uniref:lamin tail domain-containing protein n=1 Tax=Bacillus sp. NEB1478 TaxID=3073816 RepID=UPI0028731BC9|nr:lamin tail domain-containing protein [Bacillus sp. NEB1478]WNB92206.1 lamin tail domain-containing protein [Bacillus sp. NEB1478]